MKFYQVELVFTNLDNSLYTDVQASMTIEIRAGDVNHAKILAEKLRKLHEADYYNLNG